MKNFKIAVATCLQGLFLLFHLSLSAQWTVAYLSEPRERPYPVVAGSKVLFVLGSPNETGEGNRVDIYDSQTDTWSVHKLPFSSESINQNPPVVSKDGWVFILDEENLSDIVQVYNANTDTWSTITLSEPRFYVSIGVAGEYVVFAGGATASNEPSAKVDLFHVPTQTWHEASLSEGRGFLAITGLGNQVFMAGGFNNVGLSDRVDILNTDTWVNQTSTLVKKRGLIEAVTVGNKVLMAGGGEFDFVYYNQVDIYDGDTDTWSSDSLQQYDHGGIMRSAVVGHKAYFHAGLNPNVLDVYDAETGVWSAVEVPTQHALGGFTAAGNKLYLAGGVNDPAGVVEVFDCGTEQWDTLGYLSTPRYWVSAIAGGNKLFIGGGYGSGYSDVVDIYHGLSSSAEPPQRQPLAALVPNPAHDWVRIGIPNGATSLQMFDLQGHLMQFVSVGHQTDLRIELKGIPPGVYFIAVGGDSGAYWGKLIVE